MPRIRLATGITPNFIEPASAMLKSLREVCNVPCTVFAVNFPETLPPELDGLDVIRVRYSKVRNRLPKFMLQQGQFVDFVSIESGWNGDDIVIFTDADGRLQRGFSDEELEMFSALNHGEFAIGFNKADHSQTLRDEADQLFPNHTHEEIEYFYFHGSENMLCRNTGFVVARLTSWIALFGDCREYREEAKMVFNHPSWPQWVICYVVQKDFKLVDLPLSVHAHGHCGLHEGVHQKDGRWYHHDKLIAFAHCL